MLSAGPGALALSGTGDVTGYERPGGDGSMGDNEGAGGAGAGDSGAEGSGMGDPSYVAVGGIGDAVEAATADLLGPELNAYASGYSDAVNAADNPAPVEAGTLNLYAAGYGDAIGDEIAERLQNIEIEQQEMDVVLPHTPEQRAAEAQAQAEVEDLERRLFGRRGGFGGRPAKQPEVEGAPPIPDTEPIESEDIEVE